MNKIVYKTLALICLVLASFATRVSGQCEILRLDNSQEICTDKPTTFYLSCSAAISVNWYVNYSYVNMGGAFNLDYTFPSAGQYTIIASYSTSAGGGGGGVPIIDDPGGSGGSVTLLVQVSSTPQIPQIQVAGGIDTFCNNGSVTLLAINPTPEQAYSWRSVPAGFSASSASATFSNITQTTEFIVSTSNGGCTSESKQTINIAKTSFQPSADPRVLYHKKILRPSIVELSYDIHYWQTTSTGIIQTQANQAVTNQSFEVTEPGNYFIRAYSYGGNCWAAATGPLQVQLNYEPPKAEIAQAQSPGFTEIFLTNGDNVHIMRYADYFWVTDATPSASIVRQYSNGSELVGFKIFENGRYYLRGRDRGTGTWGLTLTIDVQLGDFDNSLNWVFSRSFSGSKDNAGNLEIIGESKSYFDERGQALQSQTRGFHKEKVNGAWTEFPVVFASQPLKDKYDRAVGSTLSAPIAQSDFRYHAAFALNNVGKPMTYADFDKPVPLSTDQKGTLGNYYSTQNQWNEKDVPVAKRLFSRTDFYEDGTGEERKSAQPGDTHFIGSGKEVLKGTFPVGNDPENNELKDYLEKRYSIFRKSTDPLTQSPPIKIEGVQTVVRDENERFAISIADKSGKVLMTARKGTKSFASSVSSDKMAYFYVLGAPNSTTQSVTITGTADYKLENTITNTEVTKLTSALPHVYNLQAGYYRVLPNIGTVKVAYTNYFTDIAYQFYNDAGRLVASVSPNGYEQWQTGGGSAAAYATIDKSTHVYNHQGWLLSMTETDAGETNYKYRRDGKIRFSQNAQQKENETSYAGKGRFSYTNYDKLGRPIESGEYKGTALTFASLNTALEFADQTDYALTDKTDWVKTYYDMAGTPPVSGLAQSFVRGAVSWTENANSKTWYSYDELGRVVWMAQQPTNFPLAFVTRYEYDFLGNVLTTSTRAYQGTTEKDAFYHHYEYDKNKRLVKASTSLDGANKTVQAEYFYYLHGPLKRVVMATNLQGIDFVYNIHGWLTQINHPDDSKSNDAVLSKDPGKDHPSLNGVRKDVFGMVLDYYATSIEGLGQTSSSLLEQNDPNRFHQLPTIEPKKESLVADMYDPMQSYRETMKKNLSELRNQLTITPGE